MKTYDWTKFVLRIPIKKELQVIYNAWASKMGLEKWFLRQADFFLENGNPSLIPSKGDTYKWFWHGHPDSVFETRKVLEVNGVDFFQFEFSGGSIVSVRLRKEGKLTLVELTQENIPADENPETHLYIQCQTGWTFYLTNLKSVCENGIDLRNKDENLKNVITA